jgi:hypothetical protein
VEVCLFDRSEQAKGERIWRITTGDRISEERKQRQDQGDVSAPLTDVNVHALFQKEILQCLCKLLQKSSMRAAIMVQAVTSISRQRREKYVPATGTFTSERKEQFMRNRNLISWLVPRDRKIRARVPVSPEPKMTVLEASTPKSTKSPSQSVEGLLK